MDLRANASDSGLRFIKIATLIAMVASGCSDGSTTGASVDSTLAASPTTATEGLTPGTGPPRPSNSTTPATISPAPIALEFVPIAEFDEPLAMITRPGDDRLFILERAGLLVPIDRDGTKGSTLLDISAEVSTSVERGLLGGAFSSDGAALYLHYSDLNGDTRLDQWAMAGDLLDRDSRRLIFAVDQPFGNHNGGQVQVGPDGLVYLGLGDGGAADDPLGSGQDVQSTLGSIVRLDPTSGERYTIPADNPFAEGGGAPEIFLWGVRNPWRFSFDSATGDLWVADVGQNRLEEITVLRASEGGGLGANLGWALREGTEEFSGGIPEGHVEPIYEYSHDGGNCSVTGGYVYRGTQIAHLDGQYLFADYCAGDVIALSQDGISEPLGLRVEDGQPVSFGQDQDGEIYVLSQQGQLSRIAAVSS